MHKPQPLHLVPPHRPAAAIESDRRAFLRCLVITCLLLACLGSLSGCGTVLAAISRQPTEPAHPRYCADTTRVMVATQPLPANCYGDYSR